MSATLQQAIEKIEEPSPTKRILVAHSLMFSLRTAQKKNANEVWAALSRFHLEELESSSINQPSWNAIKSLLGKYYYLTELLSPLPLYPRPLITDKSYTSAQLYFVAS